MEHGTPPHPSWLTAQDHEVLLQELELKRARLALETERVRLHTAQVGLLTEIVRGANGLATAMATVICLAAAITAAVLH